MFVIIPKSTKKSTGRWFESACKLSEQKNRGKTEYLKCMGSRLDG